MATSGPMLVSELHISQGSVRTCSCGRSSRLFYRMWVGLGGEAGRPEDVFLCSFCVGERLQVVPFTQLKTGWAEHPPTHVSMGYKIVLLPDPRATLTDDERADVDESAGFDMRTWALCFGEGILPYRVREGLEWEKLAEFQWAKQAANLRLHAADYRACDQFQFIERKDMRQVEVKRRCTPTEAEVSLLESARHAWQSFEPILAADLDLVWVQPLGEKARTELQVCICTPNGGLRRLFYTLPK